MSASVTNLRTGVAGQIGIATNALHDPTTAVTPDTFMEFENEAVADSVLTIEKQLIGGSPFDLSGRYTTIDQGMANGAVSHALLNVGYARLLRHIFGGYVFSWPGSTNGSATLTFNSAASNNDTVVIEGQTYTFKTALTASTTANEILVASSAALQASYFAAAVNRGVASNGLGSGTAYGSLTPQNVDVIAVDNGDATVTVSDRQARGAAVNSGGASEVATTETLTDASSVWDSATLVSGVNGTDTRRLHTYTVDLVKLLELYATYQAVRPPSNAPRSAATYVGKPISTVFNCADGDVLMVAPTWDTIGRDLATAVASPTYPSSATYFNYTQIAATIDTVDEPIQGMTFTFDSQQVSRSKFGTASRRPHRLGGKPTITGELTREFENTDLYNAWLAGTELALVITATGAQIPSSSSNYQFIVTIPDIIPTGSTPNVTGPNIIPNNIPFRALDDGSNPIIQVQYYTDEGYVGDNG